MRTPKVISQGPEISEPSFPGLFRSQISGSVFLMSDARHGVRVVEGNGLREVGDCFRGVRGDMATQVRLGFFAQVKGPLTVEFNPASYPVSSIQFFATPRKSTVVSSAAEPSDPVIGALYKYVGLALGSVGEIVICTGPAAATVIHSVSSLYPLGHTYDGFYRCPSEWERVTSVTLSFTS